MSKGRRIIHWVLTIFFFILTCNSFSKGGIASGILMLLLTIIALPFGPVSQLKGGKRALKWVLSIFIFFVGMMFLPQSGMSASQQAASQIAESTVSETESVTVTPTATPTPTITPTATPTPTESPTPTETPTPTPSLTPAPVSLSDIPKYSGNPYVAVNNNTPYFSDSDLTTTAFENYSDLDSLGRCGVAYANVCEEIMPTEKRGSIGSIKPTGWHTVKYDNVDGKYLYNRCHLIGYQLSAENANPKNLITGTRYLNVTGMLPYENMVADYVKETDNHVLYRVTPVFEGDNLLSSGVLMEAESVEDKGDGILFCVYCYNVQPGITINYANGDSQASGEASKTAATPKATPKPVDDNTQAASATAAVSKVWNIQNGGIPDNLTEAEVNAAQNAVNALPDTNSNKAALQTMVDASRNALREKLTAQAEAEEAARKAAEEQARQNAAAQAQTQQSSGTMVWISETGSKYHRINNCGRMNPNNAHQETESQAIAEGYGKCSKCW